MKNAVIAMNEEKENGIAEKKPPIMEIAGLSTHGYYSTQTYNKEYKGIQYKVFTQGLLRIGKIAAIFNISTHEGGEANTRKALLMLKNAKYVAYGQK